jgi:hypothetical protein
VLEGAGSRCVVDVNLVFQAQPGGTWTFMRNCLSPNDCY